MGKYSALWFWYCPSLQSGQHSHPWAEYFSPRHAGNLSGCLLPSPWWTVSVDVACSDVDETLPAGQHLNRQHPQIQFTMEMEADNQISFLDVSVKRNAGTFATKVYRKPTHTDLYLHITIQVWNQEQWDAWEVDWAETICVDETSREEELAHLRDTFWGNGYPDGIVTNNLIKPPRTTLPSDEEQPTTNPPNLFLPYIQGLSENIQNRCRKMGIRIVFKSRAPSDSSWWMWRLPYQKWTRRKLCTRSHARTAIQSTLERLAGHSEKEEESTNMQ